VLRTDTTAAAATNISISLTASLMAMLALTALTALLTV
jgi:hypothetical protein